MNVKLLFVLITANCLANLLTSGQTKVKNVKLRQLLNRAGIFPCYFLTAMLLSINWFSWRLADMVAIQAVLLTLLNILCLSFTRRHEYYKFEILVVHIIMRFFILYLTVLLFAPIYTPIILPQTILALVAHPVYYQVCIYLSACIFLMIDGTLLVRALLFKVKKNSAIQPEKDNTGKLIGNIERILILVLVLLNNLAAIGFIITAKSIARFEEMKVKKFAEYYLIGTLSSFLLALATGELAQYASRLIQ